MKAKTMQMTNDGTTHLIIFAVVSSLLLCITDHVLADTVISSQNLPWTASHADSVSINPDIASVDKSSSIELSPETTRHHTVAAEGSEGTTSSKVAVALAPIKVEEISKYEADFLTPENTNAAAKSALLQQDLDWFYQALSTETANQDKQMFIDAGINPEEKFNLVNREDIEYITGKFSHKDGIILLKEVTVNNIDGTKISLCTGFENENGQWKITFKYSNDEELQQYYNVSYLYCIASYRFAPDNLLEDSCWHGNDLTNYNATEIAIDQRNEEEMTTASFNGIDNGLGRTVLIDMPREKLSIGGWIKAGSTDHNARIIEIGNNRNDSSAIVMNPGNGLRYWLHINGTRIERNAAMDHDFHDNSWHHIYMTYDGHAMNLYVDGTLKDNHSVSGVIDSAAVLNIGQHDAINNGTAHTFKGKIDDIQIYNKALSSEEILTKFNNGTTQSL